jgi:predicted N-formylglutamate amidohydrolase
MRDVGTSKGRGRLHAVIKGETIMRAAPSERLLCAEDPPVFEVARANGRSPYVLICDHAGRALPRALGTLGVDERERMRHIAWDIGAAGVARELAARLDAFLILATYSRLAIDLNRPPGVPSSIVTISEHTRVPGNEDLSPLAAELRRRELFDPYHDRISVELDRRAQDGRSSVLVSVHSFTPTFKGDARAWHAGVLYNRDPRLGRVVLELLRAEPELHVGDNQPYAVSDATDYSIVTHGEKRGLAHVELEVRQDLITEPAGQRAWAERLARVLTSPQALALGL